MNVNFDDVKNEIAQIKKLQSELGTCTGIGKYVEEISDVILELNNYWQTDGGQEEISAFKKSSGNIITETENGTWSIIAKNLYTIKSARIVATTVDSIEY